MGLSGLKIAATFAKRLQSKIVDSYRLWPHARIDGVEVTQAIQHYRAADHLSDPHLLDPHARGVDNSVFFVAGKTAWVRVYVRSGVWESVPSVTGTLHVERRRQRSYDHVRTVSPQPPGHVTAQEKIDYATERGDVANTLNFLIQPEEFYGLMRLTVRLTDWAGKESDTLTFEVITPVRQTLRLRGVFVSYNGPPTSAVPPPNQPPPTPITRPAPTLANLQSTAGLAMRAMPVQSTGSFTSAGTIPWNRPLDDPRPAPGECTPNWGLLMDALVEQRLFDGNRADVVYYALLPAGIPLGGVTGCGRPGLSAAVTGDQATLLHEIGHAYGFQHTPAPCPNGLLAGPTDPRYPAYAPHPSGSIGEYGLDISNGRVFSPQTTFDYMSYCFPQWMSIYQHNRLWLQRELTPSHVGLEENPIDIPYVEPVIPDFDDPPPLEYKRKRSLDMEPTPIISITGVVRSSEEVEVNMVARVMAVASPLGTRTRLTAQLLGDASEPVARGQLFRLDSHAGCGCGNEGGDPGAPPYSFQAIVPDVELGTALRIVEDEREIWSRRAPERPPEVENLEVGVTEEQQLELHWHAQTAGEEPEAWAQWSADRGESWQALVGNLTGDAATVGLAGLPDGEILVRVLVLDGFFTSTSEPVRVEIPARPPEAAILHPAEGQWLYSNRTLHLWAEATDPAGEPLPDWSCRWILDDREVARGKQAWLTTPEVGEHRATLVVQASGREVVRNVRFITVGDTPR